VTSVVVFGGSATQVWEKDYSFAVQLGEALAKNGFHVINGGYFGIMGAVSRGAQSVGGQVTGVVCETFTFRDGENPWLTHKIVEKNTVSRLSLMLEMADAAIALPGKIGTLNEILMLMTLWKTRETNIPLICSKDPFEKALKLLTEEGLLDPGEIKQISFESDLEGTISTLKEKLL